MFWNTWLMKLCHLLVSDMQYPCVCVWVLAGKYMYVRLVCVHWHIQVANISKITPVNEVRLHVTTNFWFWLIFRKKNKVITFREPKSTWRIMMTWWEFLNSILLHSAVPKFVPSSELGLPGPIESVAAAYGQGRESASRYIGTDSKKNNARKMHTCTAQILTLSKRQQHAEIPTELWLSL